MTTTLSGAPGGAAHRVETITIADVDAALRRGLADFKAAPLYGLFFSCIYVAAGTGLWVYFTYTNRLWWIVPFAAGFPLVAPFAAVGLYEVSRRLEAGEPLRAAEIMGVIWSRRGGQIPYMALLIFFVFMAWILLAYGVFALAFGPSAMTNVSASLAFLDSPRGIVMLAAGALVGGGVAAVLFCVTVVSLPMLLDRDVDVVTAVVTSFAAVAASPRAMASWAGLVAGLLVIGMVPAFLGLFVVLPVLGHASWHLYRRAVP